MRRYAKKYGSTGILGGPAISIYIVIRTEDATRAAAEGYQPIDDSITDEQVNRKFCVTTICHVEDVVN